MPQDEHHNAIQGIPHEINIDSTTYFVGQNDTRPWGTWEVLALSEKVCIKKICVTPQGLLSLQYHNSRQELWFIVRGVATVTIDGVVKKYRQGESVNIAKGAQHRLYNEENTLCELIEIQFGDILDEDDIIRLEDKYGRLA